MLPSCPVADEPSKRARKRTRGEIELLVRDPGFTPGVREVDVLVEMLTDETLGKPAERAIARVGAAALRTLRLRLDTASAPLRADLVRAIGRLVNEGQAPQGIPLLIASLDDSDAKTRRNAAIALGHARASGVEDALLGAWQKDKRPEMRRSIAASLGKVGSVSSLSTLRDALNAGDPDLARIAGRASMMIERTASRGRGTSIDLARSPSRPVDILALSRRGLEDLVAEELAKAAGVEGVRVSGPGRVGARLVGPLSSLFAARTMLGFRFVLPTEWTRDGEATSEVIARAVSSEPARHVFNTWTPGSVRYRIAWASGGHRRAATWDAARAIAHARGAQAEAAPELVNDPSGSTWELVVETSRRFVTIAIAPRALVDPRFAWRLGDVPAASHPTIAAALARVSGVRSDDVVWDPFVGSGSEIIERALLGPYRALVGSDLDVHALAVARKNLTAAGVHADLRVADALGDAPRGVTLIVTNPPMGRRASRIAGLSEMLDRFVTNAATALGRAGRLVWIAPSPQRSREVAARSGLNLDWARGVDMGGFDAEMQRWVKS
jgi:23S rRNA G2445 N2-methylase RlmL